jgi:hypothetical protein
MLAAALQAATRDVQAGSVEASAALEQRRWWLLPSEAFRKLRQSPPA